MHAHDDTSTDQSDDGRLVARTHDLRTAEGRAARRWLDANSLRVYGVYFDREEQAPLALLETDGRPDAEPWWDPAVIAEKLPAARHDLDVDYYVGAAAGPIAPVEARLTLRLVVPAAGQTLRFGASFDLANRLHVEALAGVVATGRIGYVRQCEEHRDEFKSLLVTLPPRTVARMKGLVLAHAIALGIAEVEGMAVAPFKTGSPSLN